MKTLFRLSKLIAPLFPVMLLAIFFGTTGFLCAIGIPVFASISLTADFPIKILLALGVARGVLHYAEQYCNHYIAFTLLARIRNIVFAKLRELGPAKLDGKKKGELISLLTSDIELLELFYAHTVSPVCIALLTSIAVCVFIGIKSAVLALYMLLFYAAVGICVPLIVQKGAMKAGEEHRAKFSLLNAFLLDTLRGLQQSILYGTGEKKCIAIKTKSEELAKSKKKSAFYDGFTAALIDSLVIIASFGNLALSLYLFRRGLIDFGTVILSITASFSSFAPVIAVARLGSSLSETVAAGKRVLSLLDEKSIAPCILDGESVLSDDFSLIKIEDLSFSYPNEKATILENIQMSFSKGAITGIQGKSGSGKSTILKLIMRFYEAQKGGIFINSNNINSVNTASLRALEGYVEQETSLFHDTIENNIRIAKLDATKEEIEEAAKKANIHDFISSLPNGYLTKVSELGDNFSGGERQRLGLARSFLHNSTVLLLDEPTSNLDSYNEEIILQSVKKCAENRAVVLVSHRESTLKIADKIYKVSSGRKS